MRSKKKNIEFEPKKFDEPIEPPEPIRFAEPEPRKPIEFTGSVESNKNSAADVKPSPGNENGAKTPDNINRYDAPIKGKNINAETAAERKESPRGFVTVKPKKADEGEFMHVTGSVVTGLTLLGGVATYLRKLGTPESARVRELLSRGVTVKEREDAIAFVVPDDTFLLVGEKSVLDALNAALRHIGCSKSARVEKTDEDLFNDDLARARELFGRDNVSVKNARK